MSPYVDWMRFSILYFSFIKKKKKKLRVQQHSPLWSLQDGKESNVFLFLSQHKFCVKYFRCFLLLLLPLLSLPNLPVFLPLLLLLPLFSDVYLGSTTFLKVSDLIWKKESPVQ